MVRSGREEAAVPSVEPREQRERLVKCATTGASESNRARVRAP